MAQEQEAVRRVLLGVSGGIAAYKAVELTRALVRRGLEVRVVMTEGAARFVQPLTFQALSGQPVRCDLFDAEAEHAMDHIALARWPDLVLVAPATANLAARLAAGLADDLLSTLCLATRAPIALAPAMNQAMWEAPATRRSFALLEADGVRVLGPASGEQACGEDGPGRMLEPEEIAQLVAPEGGPAPAAKKGAPLSGTKVVVTSGSTLEDIDAVRFLANRSSGRMGCAMARAAQLLGAETVLVAGEMAVPPPAGVRLVRVRSAEQMRDAVLREAADAGLLIGAAAVADYRPREAHQGKRKKGSEGMGEEWNLRLVRNPDVLGSASQAYPGLAVAAFAAETEQVLEHARAKLQSKGARWVIANDVSDPGLGFASPDNEVWLVTREGVRHFPRADKEALAQQLLLVLAEQLAEGAAA